MANAILTGASSGIGHALAHELAACGYSLGLMARRTENLQSLRQSLSVPVTIQTSDFLNPDAALKDFRQLLITMGPVDLVILNAGVQHSNDGLLWENDRAMIDVNVRAFVAMADETARHFLKQGRGHLVGISSIAGTRGSGKAPVYGATKAFAAHFLQGLRQRLAAECPAITVTDIRPGFVDTALVANAPKKFWVASPQKAARQIVTAIRKKKKYAYISRSWILVAALYALAPETFLSWAYAKFIRER